MLLCWKLCATSQHSHLLPAGSGLAQSSTTSLQSFCAPFTANVDTTTWQTAQTVLNDTSIFSILNTAATGQLLGNWPPVGELDCHMHRLLINDRMLLAPLLSLI